VGCKGSHLRATVWFLAILGGLWIRPTVAADASVARADCERGVCAFNVVDNALLGEPCADGPLLAVYGEASGATLLQCGSSGTAGPLTYVFDRRAPRSSVFELEGARFMRQLPHRGGQIRRAGPLRHGAVVPTALGRSGRR